MTRVGQEQGLEVESMCGHASNRGPGEADSRVVRPCGEIVATDTRATRRARRWCGWTGTVARRAALIALGLSAGAGEAETAAGSGSARVPAGPGPVPILFVAFGTSVPAARQVFNHIDVLARRRYPNHEIRWGFTSDFIIRKLKAQGILTDRPEDVLAEFKAKGAKAVAVQSLHIVPGQEFDEVASMDSLGLTIAYGEPLLATDADIRATVKALGAANPALGDPTETVVVAAHGNEKYPEYNERNLALARVLEAAYPNAVLATVEGEPGPAPLEQAAKRAASTGKVLFVPLMIVAGDHVVNDIMGDDRDSWKNRVGARDTFCARPLGYNPGVLEIYFQHLDQALEQIRTGQVVPRQPATITGPGAEGRRIRPRSEQAKALDEARAASGGGMSSSKFARWKRRLPFWQGKAVTMLDLALVITVGVFVGQILEVSGVLRLISVIAVPLTWIGGLPRAAGPPFLMAFQSGAAANSMLVSYRDAGELSNRQLYTSVLVVSAISLFAHLPTFVVPLGMAFGWAATWAFFGVRLAAILLEIVAVLLVSRLLGGWLDRRLAPAAAQGAVPDAAVPREPRCRRETVRFGSRAFWGRVWRSSRGTLKRLLIYVVPTFVIMATLERAEFFAWLSGQVPQLFRLSFLPAEATVIIPAQAVSLYNGAIAAANFVGIGAISVRQAVIVILIGSVITAPVRTLRHALPTYLAILGARPGFVLAISAQVLRCVFVLGGTFVLMLLWR